MAYISANIQNLGVTADVTSYNILLKACCNAKRVDLAENIYGEIRYMATKGVLKLDVFTYTTMIKVSGSVMMVFKGLQLSVCLHTIFLPFKI